MCLTTSAVGGSVLLQHLLDQVDPPARAIEFVAEQHIGRAGRGAEAAMHAGAQDLVGLRDIGIGELREAEFGLHVAAPRVSRPRLRMFFGSKLWRTRSLKRGKRRAADGTRRHCAGSARAPRIRVAWPPAASTRARTSAACASGFGGSAAQIRPPPQS